MNNFSYVVENPASPDPDKIPEHLPIRVTYASVDHICKVRLVSRTYIEESVPFVPRPDLAQNEKNRAFAHFITFESKRPIRAWLGNNEKADVIVQVFHDSTVYDTFLVPLCKYAHRDKKDKKIDRFAHLLACPYCKGSLVLRETNFVCSTCAKSFRFNGNAVDFLTGDFKSMFSITDTDNISDHGYDLRITAAVENNPDKLFVDVGAGFKYKYYDNVVNFEIVDYPSTDVLGVGERLPFADNSFDGVISAVVLEHVKDPFACAREMMRVLKPGAELFCSVPFLQPRHGYPNHYYNMTAEGLINLFTGMKVVETDVPDYFHPMAALTWICGGYLQGLPDNLKENFLQMSVRELLYYFGNGKSKDHLLFTQLSKDAQIANACGTFIRAIKPEE